MNYLQLKNSLAVAGHLRNRFLLAVPVILILVSGFSYKMLQADYGVLFTQLKPEDAGLIIRQLDEAHIVWQTQNQGQDILIDKKLIESTRLKIMSNDKQSVHSVGFELFDKSDFGMTDFSQKINYQRALQGELERTINSLDEVRQSRVHLVIPESHLFQTEENRPRASVTLHLNHELSRAQIQSIQQLITASVAGLKKNQVVIVDQNGHSLTTATEDQSSSLHFRDKQLYEQYLSDKVMQLLTRIFSEDELAVKIDATLNYDELEQEMIRPENGGTLTHEKEIQHTGSHKDSKAPLNQDITREKSYQNGQKKERFSRANGTVERLTVSVVLPEHTPAATIVRVKQLVQSVVGFNEKRGDSISVEALIVRPAAVVKPLLKTQAEPFTSYFQISAGIAGSFALLLCGWWFRLRTRMKTRADLLNELNQWLSDHD